MITKQMVNTEQLLLRAITHNDILTVVKVHKQSFEGFFLTFLGSAFLSELYRAILIDPSSICFLIEYQDTVVGFVVGTENQAGFYRRLLRNRWWCFAATSVFPLLSRPSIFPRLLRAFSASAAATKVDKCGTLMSIAVLPDTQGSGIGKRLVQAFLQEAANRGLNQVDLTTDRENNEATNNFYKNLGFTCTRSFVTPEGRAMNEYVIDLPMRDAETQTKNCVSRVP